MAAQNLEAQGFLPYCPRVRRTRRHARKFSTVNEPLFPGYLFVAIDVTEQPWRSINGTFGVTRILTDTAGPVALPPGLVEEIMAVTGADLGAGGKRGAPHVGQDVRLRTGPFTDFVGRIATLAAGNRVNVLLRLMNREIMIGVDACDLDLLVQAA